MKFSLNAATLLPPPPPPPPPPLEDVVAVIGVWRPVSLPLPRRHPIPFLPRPVSLTPRNFAGVLSRSFHYKHRRNYATRMQLKRFQLSFSALKFSGEPPVGFFLAREFPTLHHIRLGHSFSQWENSIFSIFVPILRNRRLFFF